MFNMILMSQTPEQRGKSNTSEVFRCLRLKNSLNRNDFSNQETDTSVNIYN